MSVEIERIVGRPTRYYIRYLCDGYTLADAFRPHPGWGAKGYTVEAAQLGDHTDEELIKCALESAPSGYWLQRIEAIEDGITRDVFKKAVPMRFGKTPNGQTHAKPQA